RATPEEVEDLRSLAELRYQPKDRATYAQYLRDNSVFHQALACCSRNERLEGIVTSILDEIQRPLYLGLDEGLDPKTATDEHLGVVDAIAARDAAMAKRLMAEQIASTQDRIFAAVASIQADQLEAKAAAAR